MLAAAERVSRQPRLRRWVRIGFSKAFGRWPHVTTLSPYWACTQPLLAAMQSAKAAGARDALVVADAAAALIGALRVPGKIARISRTGLSWELFPLGLEPSKQFDLCVLQLTDDDIAHFADLLAKLEPYLRPGGTVIGFSLGGGQPLEALPLAGKPMTVTFTGSAASMRALTVYERAFGHICAERPAGMIAGALTIALNAFSFWRANRAEEVAAKQGQVPDPAFRTSVTIVVRLT
jgi:hypothetical protein